MQQWQAHLGGLQQQAAHSLLRGWGGCNVKCGHHRGDDKLLQEGGGGREKGRGQAVRRSCSLAAAAGPTPGGNNAGKPLTAGAVWQGWGAAQLPSHRSDNACALLLTTAQKHFAPQNGPDSRWSTPRPSSSQALSHAGASIVRTSGPATGAAPPDTGTALPAGAGAASAIACSTAFSLRPETKRGWEEGQRRWASAQVRRGSSRFVGRPALAAATAGEGF